MLHRVRPFGTSVPDSRGVKLTNPWDGNGNPLDDVIVEVELSLPASTFLGFLLCFRDEVCLVGFLLLGLLGFLPLGLFSWLLESFLFGEFDCSIQLLGFSSDVDCPDLVWLLVLVFAQLFDDD